MTAVPVLPAVRARGAGAGEAYAFADDATGALAVVARRIGTVDEAAAHMTATCIRIFRGRDHALLDPLAAIWWRAEHAGSRVAPYSALPIGDRAAVRDRVRALLAHRTPEAIGDAAALDAERDAMLALPQRALERANDEIDRRGDSDRRWRGNGASAACVLFAAGQAAVAVTGDCSAWRVRSRIVDRVTGTVHLAPRDVFVLTTTTGIDRVVPAELPDLVRKHGLAAAEPLVQQTLGSAFVIDIVATSSV